MDKFYVYVYLDPRKPGEYNYNDFKFEYEPIYIGKGANYRYREHLYSNFSKTNLFLKGKLIKIKKELNCEPYIIKLKENLNSKTAYELEAKYIKEIGRCNLKTGPLVNFTNGGEGTNGGKRKQWGEEHRRKIMEIRKLNPPRLGHKNSEHQKQSVSIALKNKPKSEEHRRKLSLAKSGGIMQGSNSPSAIKINIYNSENKLMFECNGDFVKICKENSLPLYALRRSYYKEGEPIYLKTSFEKTTKLNENYKLWYAKKVS